MDRAIHLISTGERIRKREGIASIWHLRKVGFNERIYIHGNDIRWGDIIHKIDRNVTYCHHDEYACDTPRDSDNDGDFTASRNIKTQLGLFDAANHSLNLFLDSDVVAIKDPSNIWEQIEDYKIAMAVDRFSNLHMAYNKPRTLLGLQKEWDFMLANNLIIEDIPIYNSGMILWKYGLYAKEFFTEWHKEWKRFGNRDQQAMARMLYWNPKIEIKEVSPMWNFYTFNMYYFNLKPPKCADDVIMVHSHIAAKEVYKEEWMRAKELAKQFSD